MRMNNKRSNFNKNLWPIYLKDPVEDLSSYALDLLVFSRMSQVRHKFQIDRILELKDYTYNPLTRVYLKHDSFNCGVETHFFCQNGNILGSIYIKIAEDQISNWRAEFIHAKVIEFLKQSLSPLEIVRSEDSNLFKDNYSIKAGFSLYMEIEGENFSKFVVNVYLDLSHEVGKIISKNLIG